MRPLTLRMYHIKHDPAESLLQLKAHIVVDLFASSTVDIDPSFRFRVLGAVHIYGGEECT